MNFLEQYGIKFNNIKLLERAITHSSYANQNDLESYERLEFLGDAVLEFAISAFLFENFTHLKEGELTKKRAQNVCEETLLECARVLGLQKHIRVAQGTVISNAILADVFEAILGAIYLDQDIDAVHDLLDSVLFPAIIEGKYDVVDYKSTLQEYAQADARTIEYQIVSEEGPAHNKTFTSIVKMDGITLGKGSGKTKKEAEQNAAKNALEKVAVGLTSEIE